MDNKEKITNAILWRRPIVTICTAGSLCLKVETDLFNNHIEWLIEQNDVEIFSSYDSVVAIDRFCQLADMSEVSIHI